MSKCLVIGANGFIGSHLVDALGKQSYDIRAFDRYGDRPKNFKISSNVEIISGDFLNRADLQEALKNIDFVFHLVSTTTPATAENDPLLDIDTNVHNTVQLLEECVDAKVKKFVFASTGGAIYGDIDSDKPINEDVNPQPISPYAIGKLTIEHYLRYFNRRYGLSTLTYRISNPYGERHSPVNRQGVIPIFLHQIAINQPISILGDGTMIRDYLYVGDVADLIAETFEEASQPLYNLGSGRGMSLNELVDTIQKVTGRDIKKEYKTKPPTFVQKVILDVSRFKKEFNVAPKTNIEEGIKKTWKYVLETEHLVE